MEEGNRSRCTLKGRQVKKKTINRNTRGSLKHCEEKAEEESRLIYSLKGRYKKKVD